MMIRSQMSIADLTNEYHFVQTICDRGSNSTREPLWLDHPACIIILPSIINRHLIMKYHPGGSGQLQAIKTQSYLN